MYSAYNNTRIFSAHLHPTGSGYSVPDTLTLLAYRASEITRSTKLTTRREAKSKSITIINHVSNDHHLSHELSNTALKSPLLLSECNCFIICSIFFQLRVVALLSDYIIYSMQQHYAVRSTSFSSPSWSIPSRAPHSAYDLNIYTLYG